MNRTYNILASGAQADRAKGEIGFLISVSDLSYGKRTIEVFVPLDTRDITTAEEILTSQVTNSFSAAGLVTEHGEIDELVTKMSNLIKKEHPHFIPDPLGSAMMNVVVQTTNLPQNDKTRILFFFGHVSNNAPFAGVDVWPFDQQSVDGAEVTLRAQVAAFGVSQSLSKEEEQSLANYLVSILRSRCA